MATLNTKEEFEKLLEDAAEETGVSLKQSRAELAAYMAERAAHLSTITQEPGFADAVIAERDNVAMRAGLALSSEARALDQRFLGILGGALRIAALALT